MYAHVRATDAISVQLPPLCNPADHLMEITNSDFRDSPQDVEKLVECI